MEKRKDKTHVFLICSVLQCMLIYNIFFLFCWKNTSYGNVNSNPYLNLNDRASTAPDFWWWWLQKPTELGIAIFEIEMACPLASAMKTFTFLVLYGSDSTNFKMGIYEHYFDNGAGNIKNAMGQQLWWSTLPNMRNL